MTLSTHGAHLDSHGNTNFALWAPSAHEVALVLGSGDRYAMQAGEHGWFATDVACPAGTRYQFLIDGQHQVPDPASRAQAHDVHGPSVVVDPRAYPWMHNDWQGRPWHETVLYEVHVGALGGYAGVARELPRLAELGITAIELMPLGSFAGQRNWGYDGVLTFAPQREYGSPDELRALIDQAHGLGLMVFVDVIYNHFGPDGNYLGLYARDFFRHDRQTPWGDAIDFRRREVRDFFIENALMWLLDYRVDGLRLDAVHAIEDDDFLRELAQRVRQATGSERQVHLVLENEDNNAALLQDGFDAQWNDDGHNVLHCLLTGEQEGYYADFSQDATRKLARCLGEGFIYQGETSRRGTARGQPSGHLPPTAFVLFLQNHDQTGNRAFGERLVSLADPEALRAAVALHLLCPMVPLLFMGEEWGCEQPFLFFTDHHDALGDAVREGRRSEFADFAAFADAERRNTIPDPNALSTFHASVPQRPSDMAQSHGWPALYQQLLALRQRWITPRLPGAQLAQVTVLADGALTSAWLLGDGSELRIDLNLGDADAAAAPPAEGADLLFATGLELDSYLQSGTLPPRSLVATLRLPS
ncbi:MAG: malto-oligosyltrehalose trehalohydrolase [Gammaproteobacteria bacterium]|nr:malto-oligosyltrehalose trehalohydrolase [Gammaproteobacteria bacterium]MBU1489555.1 malto-oligosyltrehalose trehalohydrolase [Gammaproteobacteria bacterium]MBU2067826.1 malto-oligosyltrehalose trehalohydrolase [Gammaproteobacteria bacterium]MBU2141009.1 malto-oligosyltrehalose trehalohydrolase [Gammaproteobacteria bacterium]MBU2217360.1 malto-oligosyltrehalose trehalohydrolase [Gammaproteobacteria bacterium]